jgi:hypothetical protein
MELDSLQEAAMLGLADSEMEVDEEEWFARKEATAIRRLSDVQLYDAGNDISSSNGESKDTEMDRGAVFGNVGAGDSELESCAGRRRRKHLRKI